MQKLEMWDRFVRLFHWRVGRERAQEGAAAVAPGRGSTLRLAGATAALALGAGAALGLASLVGVPQRSPAPTASATRLQREEEEVARRAKLASWIVARERERRQELRPRRELLGAAGAANPGAWDSAERQARIPPR